MELKKILIPVIFILFFNSLNADSIAPNEKLLPYDVVKIQLEALKNNNKNDDGIKVTWLFAHPDNKKITGPYERFRIMIYGQQYRQLLNHDSHKIKLVTKNLSTYIYNIELISKDKKMYFYKWHLEKSSTDECSSCWFTTIVSPPLNIGDAI